MGLGESLARLRSVPTTAAFVCVAYLAGGVVVAAPFPFGLPGEGWGLLLLGQTDDGGVHVVPSLVASSCMISSLHLHSHWVVGSQ